MILNKLNIMLKIGYEIIKILCAVEYFWDTITMYGGEHYYLVTFPKVGLV